MATYEKTHPWIKFQIDLRPAPIGLWISLGEARSKCQHLLGVPLKPAIAQQLHQIYLARGALATTAIEGNTLTEEQALAIVRNKSELPKSQAYLAQEIQNILDAANAILQSVEEYGPTPITPGEIKQYNALVLRSLEVEGHVVPGEFVRTDVVVAGYHAAPWQENELLVSRLCEWLNGNDFRCAPDDEIVYGIIKAIVAHLYLVWIHPFGDGNGRTARLLEVRFLTEAGVPSAAGQLLSNFYNKTRTDYYRRLAEASASGGNIIPFIAYAVSGFVDQLKEQLRVVKGQQWSVSWENFVYERFRGRDSPSDRRQLKLVLALAGRTGFVSKQEIKHLTPELAELYATKTDKTLSRDLNALEVMGLIERGPEGSRATSEQILAFLPRARKGSIQAQLREATASIEPPQGTQLLLPM